MLYTHKKNVYRRSWSFKSNKHMRRYTNMHWWKKINLFETHTQTQTHTHKYNIYVGVNATSIYLYRYSERIQRDLKHTSQIIIVKVHWIQLNNYNIIVIMIIESLNKKKKNTFELTVFCIYNSVKSNQENIGWEKNKKKKRKG